METFGVVYLIINMVNGKRYVGQTVKTIEKRFNEHAWENTVIGRAIRKYGKENFKYGAIKSCATSEKLNSAERYFIAALKSKSPNGYNCTGGGEGIIGLKRTPEHNAKIGASNKGKIRTPEARAKMSKSHTGKKLSPKHKANIATTLCGIPKTPEHCANISKGRRAESPYKNLTAEIDARRISYRHLAKLLGLAPQNISRKMIGQRNFTERDKAKLVEIFDLPTEYLFQVID